jgi:hypothetical protein
VCVYGFSISPSLWRRSMNNGAHEECGTPRLVAEEPKGNGQGLVRLLGWS